MQTFDTTHFRNRLTTYVVLSLLLICAIISGLTIASQYSILKENSKANLLLQVESKRLILNSYLLQILGLTRQLGNHRYIRNQLDAYNLGKITLEQLRQNTEPHLQEEIDLIPEVISINRFSVDGHLTLTIGRALPERYRPLSPSGPAPRLMPVFIDGKLLLKINAPIVDNGRLLGTDIILFSPPDISQIFTGDPKQSQGATFLWDRSQTPRLLISPPNLAQADRIQIENCQPLKRVLASLTANSGMVEYNNIRPRTIAHAQLTEGNWILTTIVDQDTFYATMHQQLRPILVIALGLTLLGGGGMFIMLRPMTRQVLIHSDELAQVNQTLQQEISERQQAEAELIATEHEWANTFESIADAITILDSGGNIRKQNLAARRISSSYGSALKEKPQRKNLVPVSGYPSPLLEQALMEQQQVQQIYPDEGTNSYFRIILTPLYDNGQLLGAVQLVQDITEPTRIEKMKSETIAAVSHEIRTPLTAIMGFVDFMQNHDTTQQERKSYFATIQREMTRLHELMNDFLDLQRLQSAMIPYHFETLDIGMIVQEAVNLFKMASPEHQLIYQASGSIPAILGDNKRLLQVLKNILSNAMKYSPDGGTITVTLRGSRDRVFIWIKDEGIGIPPQDQEKIFNRFYRVNDSDGRIPGGLGLGLTLVQEIVNAHHGRIWVESSLGKGSTFFIELPDESSSA
ncbi:MAG: PAS domain S-box protein [Desulfuromonas sp.]|nr:PAS domain S-box protein [Desulfuromonas sp.]